MAQVSSVQILVIDPDTSFQIFVGFIATAWLTFFCCIAKVVLEKCAPANVRVLRAITSTVTSFSDQQMIIGLVVVFAGLSQLKGGISIYHWQAISSMAWLSAATHNITLTVMQKELKSNTPMKILRSVSSGVLVVFVAFASWPSGMITTYFYHSARPAQCFYSGTALSSRFNWLYYVLLLSFLVFSVITRIAPLYYTTEESEDGRLNDPRWRSFEVWLESWELAISTETQHSPRLRRFWVKHCFEALESIYMLSLAGSELYHSRVWEVSHSLTPHVTAHLQTTAQLTWLFFGLAWSTARVVFSRTNIDYIRNTVHQDVANEQNAWGFGQVVSLGLLVCPLFTFFGKYVFGPFLSYISYPITEAFYSEPALQMIPPVAIELDPITISNNQSIEPQQNPLPEETRVTPFKFRDQLTKHHSYHMLIVLWYLLSVKFVAELMQYVSFPSSAYSLLSSTPRSSCCLRMSALHC